MHSADQTLVAADGLGVDLVHERVAPALIHVVEDTLDPGALPFEAAGRPELEHDNPARTAAARRVIVSAEGSPNARSLRSPT